MEYRELTARDDPEQLEGERLLARMIRSNNRDGVSSKSTVKEWETDDHFFFQSQIWSESEKPIDDKEVGVPTPSSTR